MTWSTNAVYRTEITGLNMCCLSLDRTWQSQSVCQASLDQFIVPVHQFPGFVFHSILLTLFYQLHNFFRSVVLIKFAQFYVFFDQLYGWLFSISCVTFFDQGAYQIRLVLCFILDYWQPVFSLRVRRVSRKNTSVYPWTRTHKGGMNKKGLGRVPHPCLVPIPSSLKCI